MLTVEHPDGAQFDALVFGERAPRRWIQWLLYYAAADRHIGLAVFTPDPESAYSLAK